MRRASWKPKPEERERFYNVYIDESSHTKAKYLLWSALIVPYVFAERFEADIVAAREKTRIPAYNSDGTLKVLKWENCNNHSFEACKNTVDAVFAFKTKHKMPLRQDMRIECLAINTHERSMRRIGGGDRVAGLEKEFYFLGGVCVSRHFRDGLFVALPDRNDFKTPLQELRGMLNNGAKKHDFRKDFPFRIIDYESPQTSLSHQVVDLFMGALAYQLNGHFNKSDASEAKKELCKYIWKIFSLHPTSYVNPHRTKYFMNWIHRPGPKDHKKKPFQNEPLED